MAFSVSYLFQARDQFSGISRKIKRSTDSVRESTKGLNRELGKTNTRIKRTQRTVARATNSMAGGFRRLAAAGLAFFGAREFLRTGTAFQDAMADLSAITGATGKDFDMLRAKTMAMAKAAAVGQADVATAIKLVASAKPELLKNLPLLLKTTDQVLLLKNAAGIELASAAQITAESLNIFGKGAEFASDFVNILAAGAKFGSSEIAETGKAAVIAGGNARNAGLDFVQMNAAIQVAAAGGFKGARAGTALSAIFGRLQRLGLDFEKLGLQKTFELVKKAIEGETDVAKRATLVQKIFGEEHAKVGFAIINNVEMLGDLERKLKGTNVAQEQASVRMATFSTKMRSLGIIIADKVIQVFDQLVPTLNELTVQFTEFIDTITPQQIQQFSQGLKTFVLASVEVVKELSTNMIPVIKDFMGNMDTVTIKEMAQNIISIADAVNILLAPLKTAAALLKGFGIGIGEGVAQLATGDFRQGTDFFEAFSLGGRFLGVGPQAGIPIPAPLTTPTVPAANGGGESSATIDVNIKAPEGVVEGVKTRRRGPQVSKRNLGVNMEPA